MSGRDDPNASRPAEGTSRGGEGSSAAAGNEPDDTRAARRRARRRVRLRRLGWLAAAVIVLLVAGTTYAWIRLNSNITRVDVTKMLGTRPSEPTATGSAGPLNILILGSDTRKNLGTTAYGTDTIEGGDHSDTNLLVHLSANREWATVVSIPRDSMVPGPRDCSATDPVSDWEVRQWNYNYNLGGPGCTIRTLEGNTGIYVNHFAVVNFAGFKDMVDALGGVEVCTTKAVDDKDSGLALSPGRHILNGEQALGYVRARKTIGDGSDIGRIKRQQAFMSSVIQEATATSILFRPDKLYGFLNAATKALTTDPDFDTGTMRDVALSVRNLSPKDIDFVTVPVETYPADPNRVQWTPSAELIWGSIKADRRLEAGTASPSAGRSATSAAPLTVSPDKVGAVRVRNASGVPGLASQAAKALVVQGFDAVAVSDAPLAQGVTVAYSAGSHDAARTVAAAFPGAELVESKGLGTTIQVTLGLGSPAVVAVPNRIGTHPIPEPTIRATPSQTGSGSWSEITPRTADADICS